MTMQKITLAVAALLSACSMAPPLEMPQVPVAPQYKEIGSWAAAQPADQLPRGAWWTLYRDPGLDALEQQLLRHGSLSSSSVHSPRSGGGVMCGLPAAILR